MGWRKCDAFSKCYGITTIQIATTSKTQFRIYNIKSELNQINNSGCIFAVCLRSQRVVRARIIRRMRKSNQGNSFRGVCRISLCGSKNATQCISLCARQLQGGGVCGGNEDQRELVRGCFLPRHQAHCRTQKFMRSATCCRAGETACA